MLVRAGRGPVFDNVEAPGGRVQVVSRGRRPACRPGPAGRRGARRAAWSLGPGRGRDRRRVGGRRSRTTRYVAVGWQGFLRDLAPGGRSARRPRRRRRSSPRRPGRGQPSRPRSRDAARDVWRPAPSRRRPAGDAGRRGGLLSTSGAMARPRPCATFRPRTDRELDPTGAGDMFLAALLASALRPAIVGRRARAGRPDLRFAAAAARSPSRARAGRRPGPGGRARPTRPRAGPPGDHADDGLTGRAGGLDRD